MGKQLILAISSPMRQPPTHAVKQVKDWDRVSPDIKLGAIGILVQGRKGKIKTHKLGTRRTGDRGSRCSALAGLLSGGMTCARRAADRAASSARCFHKGLGPLEGRHGPPRQPNSTAARPPWGCWSTPTRS